VWSLTDYLVGTGGWAYFKVSGKPKLKAYSEVFNFVEVNYTFYEYPDQWTVEGWRRTVPKYFKFAVRCHQDLTHKVGLRPVDEAYNVLDQMLTVCRILDSPFLVLETPASYAMDREALDSARAFISSLNLHNVRLVWEVRAPLTTMVSDLMRDFDVIQSVDLSKSSPSVESDVIYSRLFGKGEHNIYQFTDDELLDVDRKIETASPRVAALSYHGVRMNVDAARFMRYKKTGKFLPITEFTGIDSARSVLSEDSQFPISKSELLKHQGWKVIDLTLEKRVRLSQLLSKVPEKTYYSVDEVAEALEAII
jgi:uncharacterized protein YecE (DUF72 family)